MTATIILGALLYAEANFIVLYNRSVDPSFAPGVGHYLVKIAGAVLLSWAMIAS